MLPKSNRLKKEKDFERVFNNGRGFKRNFLFLKIFDKKNKEPTRFGFVVSTKISKKAVDRNKLKRQLREITRAKLPEIKKGYDVVVVTQPGIQTQSFHQLKQTLYKLLSRAGLL